MKKWGNLLMVATNFYNKGIETLEIRDDSSPVQLLSPTDI